MMEYLDDAFTGLIYGATGACLIHYLLALQGY